MSRMPDLVQDSKLETRFQAGYTVHVYHESDPNSRQRGVLREEYWMRVKSIGEGTYGKVWLEHCVKGKLEAGVRAMKVIRCHQQPLEPVNYYHELEAIAKFSHPKYERCFVKSFGWYDRAEDLCIAMEYLPLGDLRCYLSATPALPELEAQQITFQVLEGISFMHTNGFAHRDLKPANILIRSKSPESWWVKIGDFGISKRAAESSTLVGTPGFIAPELYALRLEGKEPSRINSYATDMWSMGHMTFQMLTKQPAFRERSLLASDVQNLQHFPLSLLRAHSVSNSAQDFIQSLMTFTPEDRLTAQQASLHMWMEPLRFSNPRPSSIASIRYEKSLPESGESSHPRSRLPVPQEELTGLTGEVLAEPSGSWSVSSGTALQPGLVTNGHSAKPTMRLNAASATANSIENAPAKKHAASVLSNKSHGRTSTPELAFQTAQHPSFRPPTPSLSAPSQEWLISPEQKRQFDSFFDQHDVYGLGYINEDQGALAFSVTELGGDILGHIWRLADTSNRGKLDKDEFAVAMYLIQKQVLGRHALPDTLPPRLVPPRMRLQVPRSTSPTLPHFTTLSATTQEWLISPEQKRQFDSLFDQHDVYGLGYINGDQGILAFSNTGLGEDILGHIWRLADTSSRGKLDKDEFAVAMYLIQQQMMLGRHALPDTLPPRLVPPRMRLQVPRSTSPTLPHFTTLSATTQEWLISPEQKRQFDSFFDQRDVYGLGYINGDQGILAFSNTGLGEDILGHIWELADTSSRGRLDKDEFAVAMYLIQQQMMLGRHALPDTLPPRLVPPRMRLQVPRSTTPTLPQFTTLSATTQEWLISSEQKRQFDSLFDQLDVYGLGYINGDQGVLAFSKIGLGEDILGHIWRLADTSSRGKLDKDEFAVAMYLIQQQKELGRHALPDTLPPGLVPPTIRTQSAPY